MFYFILFEGFLSVIKAILYQFFCLDSCKHIFHVYNPLALAYKANFIRAQF